MIEQYKILHKERKDYGKTSEKQINYILPYVRSLQPQTILDYGCGKSDLLRMINGFVQFRGYKYDPAIEGIDKLSVNKVDLVINTDVLEHIPENELDNVLSEIRSLSDKAFFNISLVPAKTILPNGENAHCSVHPKGWWIERLRKHFDFVKEVRSYRNDTCSLITWDANEVRQPIKRNMPIMKWDELQEYLKDKTIAVVGNAASIFTKGNGKEIEEHDVIIRFNRGFVANPKSQGTRTDILVLAIALKQEDLERFNPKAIIYRREKFARTRAGFAIPDNVISKCRKQVGCDASSGYVAIDVLLDSMCKKPIDLYGFDWGKTKTFYNRDSYKTPHDYNIEEEEVLKHQKTGEVVIK